MKRLLLLDTGKEWGGGTNSLLELLRRIDRSRYEITPLFYDNYARGTESSLKEALASAGYALHLLPRLRQPFWAKLGKELARGLLIWSPRHRAAAVFAIEQAWRIRPDARRIARILREGGYDALYLNNQPSSNLEGLLAAERAGVPAIQHCRIESDLNPTEIATANRATQRIICVSQGVAESLVAQGIDPALCRVVLNGVDGEQALPDRGAARQAHDYADGDIVVGAVGSLVPRKGVLTLLAALYGLPGVHALIVGDGPQRAELEREAARLGMGDRVRFTGFRQAPLIDMAAMDIFCLPSAREGLPRVILEAMLLAKPVVATDIPGSRELVRREETGLLVPHGDAGALHAALARLAADAALRERMGQRGREVVLAENSIRSYVAGVERLFAEALA